MKPGYYKTNTMEQLSESTFENLKGHVPHRRLVNAFGELNYYKKMLAIFIVANTLTFIIAVVYFF